MNFLDKRNIILFSYLLIVLALAGSFYLAFQRISVEREYDRVEILVNYTELQALANANDLTLVEITKEFKDKSVTGVLFKETSLGDLARTGHVFFYQGKAIESSPLYTNLSPDITLSDGNIIMVFNNSNKKLVNHVINKYSGAKFYEGYTNAITFPINIPNSDRERELILEDIRSIGVGFDNGVIKSLADLGLSIVPQIRDWKAVTDPALRLVAEEIKSLPNLSHILFNDQQVPGYPEKIRELGDLLKNDKGEPIAPIGTIEFFDQKGINHFVTYMNKEGIRFHSISSGELGKYTQESAIDRFHLAVSERNIRSVFVRFFNMSRPAGALEENLAFVDMLKNTLEKDGYTLGQAGQLHSIPYSRILIALIGLGVIAGGILILAIKDFLRLSVLLGLLGVVGWVGLLFLSPILARKLMALSGVIIFPTLACMLALKEESRSILASVIALLIMSFISFTGAMLMVGLLADKLFMLKLDQFIGVKIAHAIPLILVPCLVFLLADDAQERVQNLLDRFLTYKFAILAVFIAIMLGIYLARTGNEATGLVTGVEEQLRAALNNILGVRPRTKEFLIGHPLTLLALYLGVNGRNWFLTLAVVIGQVSLVNTYAQHPGHENNTQIIEDTILAGYIL